MKTRARIISDAIVLPVIFAILYLLVSGSVDTWTFADVVGTSTKRPVTEAFLPLRLGEVKPEGWIKAQLRRDLESGYQGNLDQLLRDIHTGKALLLPEENDFVFRKQNKDSRIDEHGRCVPPSEYTWWHGEMIADWQEGLIRGAFLADEPKAKRKAERFVEDLLKSQDEDGYIGIYPKGFRYHFAIGDGELWTQRCALLCLLSYYEFTVRKDVLDAVERAVKLTIRQYGPGKRYFHNPAQKGNGTAHGMLFVDVLDRLYRMTGDDEYRQAAITLYRDDFSTSKTVKNAAAQLNKLLDPDNPLSGHGPDAMGLIRVPLLCYYLTGDKTFRKAWENAFQKTTKNLGVGGSPLSGQQEEIMTKNQSPGLPYEYCSTFYFLHSLIWAMQKTGNPHYGDMFEKTLFNAAQGARFANGKAITYYSADERLWVRQRPPEGKPNARYIYTAAHYPSCCHNSAARTYPYAISAMWMRSRGPDGEGLAATLYGPNCVSTKIRGAAVTVEEKTNYPFAFDIDFVIKTDREVKFPLRLRVPEWSGEPTVVAAGAKVTRDKRGFIVVSKRWKTGDTVRLTLSPTIHGRPAVDGTTAVAYGPLVYCLTIPEKAEITQRFPHAEKVGLTGFYGYQYDSMDLATAKRPLKLHGDKPDFGFTVVTNKNSNPLYPWESIPLKLRGELIGADGKPEAVTLQPMGCTILRRTCFPVGTPAGDEASSVQEK
ncbi:MAG: glycoside hydrolase family 127 protein [Pirellulales bacterium]|nr:glycoside hydrolase family 127 protein [Pirellulales bacterium]